MAAPVAQPAALRILNGRTPGHDSGGRPIVPGPAFKRVAPEKPRGMTTQASKHWDAIVPELSRLDLLSQVQVGNLFMLCEAYSRWHKARTIRAAEGVLHTGSQGRAQHPAAILESAAMKDYLRLSLEFGMTPSAEQRIASDGGADDGASPFAGG